MAATQHVVRAGETLAGIAARHGVSVGSLVEANGIRDPNFIVVGQQLTIPGRGSSNGGATYRVREGDTLATIARKHGSSISAIAAANDITNPNRIVIGQRLVIPAGGAQQRWGGGGGGSVNPNASAHIVKSGESLASIARRYGVSSEQIAAANGIVDGRIYANSRLFLEPRNVAPATTGSAGGTVSHTVTAGQNLAGIAARYGSSVAAIAKANGISNPNRIIVGHVLKVPTGRGAAVVCPVSGARFMNDWGFPRSGGRYHEGTDLMAPRGTPVRAPVSGRIEQVVGNMGGNQFRLWGTDGTTYIGAHLDAYGRSGRVRRGRCDRLRRQHRQRPGWTHPPPLRDPPAQRPVGEPVPDGPQRLLSPADRTSTTRSA